jgi:hypothetical protein
VTPRRPVEDDSGPAWVELYVLGPDGRETPFVTGEVNVSNVLWMDDEALAFATKRQGDEYRSVYRISTRGGEARKLFEHDRDVSSSI